MKKKKLLSIFMVTIIAAGLLAGCTSKTSENNDEDAIRIVHKNFTEQRLVGQLFSVYLESKGFKTTVIEIITIPQISIFNSIFPLNQYRFKTKGETE